MLILTRKCGESIYIGDKIKVTVVEVRGNQIRLGIDAPKEYRIFREEIYRQIVEENREAAFDSGIAGAQEALDSLRVDKTTVESEGRGKARRLVSRRIDKNDSDE